MEEGFDSVLWRHAEGKFRNNFSTKKTWDQIRTARSVCSWHKGVWFSNSTPKYAFIMWVAVNGRLQTADRMQKWNSSINTTCSLCQEAPESCIHLFFGCDYSGTVWRKLVEGLMKDAFTMNWSELIDIVSKPWVSPIKTFILRYVFQATIYAIWWERNTRRHEEKQRNVDCLVKLIDKNMRLKLLSLKGKGDYYEDGLITWFEAQQV